MLNSRAGPPSNEALLAVIEACYELLVTEVMGGMELLDCLKQVLHHLHILDDNWQLEMHGTESDDLCCESGVIKAFNSLVGNEIEGWILHKVVKVTVIHSAVRDQLRGSQEDLAQVSRASHALGTELESVSENFPERNVGKGLGVPVVSDGISGVKRGQQTYM